MTNGFNPVTPPIAANAEQFFTAARKAWQEAGREPTQPQIVVRVNHDYIADHDLGNERQFLTGSVAQVREDVGQLAAWGATEVFFDLMGIFAHLPDGFKLIMDQVHLLRAVA